MLSPRPGNVPAALGLPDKIALTANLAGRRLDSVQITIVHDPLDFAFDSHSPGRDARARRCRSLLAWAVRGFLPAVGCRFSSWLPDWSVPTGPNNRPRLRPPRSRGSGTPPLKSLSPGIASNATTAMTRGAD